MAHYPAIHEIEPFYDWSESTIHDAKAIGALMGIDIDKVYFTGFSSQGDGACFTGSLAYAKGCAKAVRAYAPLDTELHRIADAWQAAHKRTGYRVNASVNHKGRYYHENSNDFYFNEHAFTLSEGNIDDFIETARDFMRWIYRALEREYNYQSAWCVAQAWQGAADDMSEARASARQLVRDMRAARNAGIEAATSICTALRSKLRDYIDAWEAAHTFRSEIEGDFAYYRDGKQLDVATFAQAEGL